MASKTEARKISRGAPKLVQQITKNLEQIESKISEGELRDLSETTPLGGQNADISRSARNEINYLVWDTKSCFAQLKSLKDSENFSLAPVDEKSALIAAENYEPNSTPLTSESVLEALTKKFESFLQTLQENNLLDLDSSNFSSNDGNGNGKMDQLPLPSITVQLVKTKSETDVTNNESEVSELFRPASHSLDEKCISSQRSSKSKKTLHLDVEEEPQKKISTAAIRQTTGSWKRKRCMIPVVFFGVLLVGIIVLVLLVLFYFRKTKIV